MDVDAVKRVISENEDSNERFNAIQQWSGCRMWDESMMRRAYEIVAQLPEFAMRKKGNRELWGELRIPENATAAR